VAEDSDFLSSGRYPRGTHDRGARAKKNQSITDGWADDGFRARDFAVKFCGFAGAKNHRTEILGLVQGHTVFAIWLGKDLSALVRLIIGGELTEYTEMMGQAREEATNRMIAQAAALNADGIINVRYMTTSVVGTAAELLVYGTAVKLGE
jgi:uncharacterized protein YbjQ (UPF0145 family)